MNQKLQIYTLCMFTDYITTTLMVLFCFDFCLNILLLLVFSFKILTLL